MYALGIDIGGTAIKTALVDFKGTMHEKRVVLTEGNVIETLQSLIEEYMKRFKKDIISIGVGTAGRVDVNGRIMLATANIKNWTGMPIKAILEKISGKPVVVINDANAAAYGEWKLYHSDIDSFFLLTVGTGLGGGYIHRGEIMIGCRGEAAEVGHIILHDKGALCSCGKRGCAEQYISMKWLHNKVREKTGEVLERKELLKQFKNGSSLAVKEAVNELCHELARVIDTIMFFFDPVIIAVGGGIVELGSGLLMILKKFLEPYFEKALYGPNDIVLANSLNNAGIIGAGLYSLSKLKKTGG